MSRPISAAYLERKLRAILGVQGSNPLPDLSDALGLITLENDRPEWALPGGERLLAQQSGVAAFAGELSWVGVAVPRNGGVITIVERMDLLSTVSAAGAFLRMIGDSSFDAMLAASTQASMTPVDGREDPLVFASATKIITGHSVAGPGGTQFWSMNQNSTALVYGQNPLPVVLGPGSALLVVGPAVNVAINSCMFRVRERPLEGDVEIK